ncbi:hypothetical protein [Ruminococcus sp. 210702-SL.1.03]|uniref:hypothetical protein n=1 Tax=Ruminococcus sp. 210702-SL.1.03 TaxID=2883233 RepID=UPI001D08A7E4|nr:hypothetical protein [Ruminococcus sp. 210702-SL.1.03]MCB6617197.1 hypothetical protein [Ruminococcus sp. 210702-SL.1.03]
MMIVNVWTKEAFDFEMVDLSEEHELREDVLVLYNKHKGDCERFLVSRIFDTDTRVRRFYVYAWFAKMTPKSYFYVGKGTGKRYDHILADIKKYKDGKNNFRFERYSKIQDKWGIDCEILLDKLTEYEALICEECIKLEFLANGEALLNVEGMPMEYLPINYQENDYYHNIIYDDPVFRRFLGDCGEPYFDEVEHECLMRTYIYPYFVALLDPKISSDKEFITKWLAANNAKLYKTPAKGVRSVIIQGSMEYERYYDYRSKGKKLYRAEDVIEFIRERKVGSHAEKQNNDP